MLCYVVSIHSSKFERINVQPPQSVSDQQLIGAKGRSSRGMSLTSRITQTVCVTFTGPLSYTFTATSVLRAARHLEGQLVAAVMSVPSQLLPQTGCKVLTPL
jgi:hypothetical protein